MNVRVVIFNILLFSVGLSAQDIHFSMFQMAPVALNPALAGSFSGTARVGGIYRVQDVIGGSSANAASRGYETYTAFLDAPVIRGIREQDWVGIGLGLTSDIAGIGNVRTTSSIQSIAYHMPLGRKGRSRSTLSFAISSGTLSYSVRQVNNFSFESSLTGGIEDPIVNELQDPMNERTRGDFGGGIILKSNIDKVSAARGGISVAHLNSPKLSSQGSARTPMRITGFFEYDRLLNARTKIIPALIYQNFGSNHELALQTLTGYYLDPKKDITVYAGLGARINTLNPIDAIPIYLGFDMKDLQVRLAFDMTVSGKSYTNRGFGALELSANYILKIYKRPKVDPSIFCPRF